MTAKKATDPRIDKLRKSIYKSIYKSKNNCVRASDIKFRYMQLGYNRKEIDVAVDYLREQDKIFTKQGSHYKQIPEEPEITVNQFVSGTWGIKHDYFCEYYYSEY